MAVANPWGRPDKTWDFRHNDVRNGVLGVEQLAGVLRTILGVLAFDFKGLPLYQRNLE